MGSLGAGTDCGLPVSTRAKDNQWCGCRVRRSLFEIIIGFPALAIRAVTITLVVVLLFLIFAGSLIAIYNTTNIDASPRSTSTGVSPTSL